MKNEFFQDSNGTLKIYNVETKILDCWITGGLSQVPLVFMQGAVACAAQRNQVLQLREPTLDDRDPVMNLKELRMRATIGLTVVVVAAQDRPTKAW